MPCPSAAYGKSVEAGCDGVRRDLDDSVKSSGVDTTKKGLQGDCRRDYAAIIIDRYPAASIPTQFLSKYFLGPQGFV